MKFGLLIDLLKRETSASPKPEVKLRLGVRHLENRYNIIHNSTEDSPILTKFYSLMQTDIPNAVMWSKSKPEVEFQDDGRLFFPVGKSYISAVD